MYMRVCWLYEVVRVQAKVDLERRKLEGWRRLLDRLISGIVGRVGIHLETRLKKAESLEQGDAERNCWRLTKLIGSYDQLGTGRLTHS
jgi:hypothetical protein